MTAPTCPHCNTTMTPRHFHGYYERFAFWQCGCKVIPNATVALGAYGYSTEGALVDAEGNEIQVWDEEVVDR